MKQEKIENIATEIIKDALIAKDKHLIFEKIKYNELESEYKLSFEYHYALFISLYKLNRIKRKLKENDLYLTHLFLDARNTSKHRFRIILYLRTI